MSGTESSGPAVSWDDAMVSHWLANADAREVQFGPVSAALFERAALRPGERVLDIGVGAGPTTALAHEAVQPGGSVTAVDVSPAMIAAARQRVPAPDIEWIVADAGSHDFQTGAYDAVISRFGLMFFPDPVDAFRRLHEATVPAGRLVATVWGRRDASPLFAIPYTVATTTLQRLGVSYRDVGPDDVMFSLGNPDTARSVLEAAGWAEIESTVNTRTLYLGGGGSVEAAVRSALVGGPIARVLEGQPADAVEEVRRALTVDFEHRHDGVGIGLPGGFVVLGAVRP
jgi:SAM-dependent methyltransferase